MKDRIFLVLATTALLWGCGGGRNIEDGAPIASFEVVGEPFAGQAVTVDATASHGHGDLEYTWRTAPGAAPVATGAVAQLTFHVPGDNLVWLDVRDQDGHTATASSVVTVLPDFVPPLAHAGLDIETEAGEVVDFDGTGSVDNVAIASWSWDFDASDGPYFDSHERVTTHVYTAAGLYRATLSVVDAAGNESTDERIVRVWPVPDTNAPVAVAGADRRVHRGATAVIDARDSRDDVAIARFEWDTPGATIADVREDAGSIALSYAETGDYHVGVRVFDAAGNVGSDELTVHVVIDSESPQAALDGPAEVRARSVVAFDASASTDDTEIVVWAWTVDGLPLEGERAVAQFSVDTVGTHTVEVTAYDGAGRADTASATFVASAPVPAALIPVPATLTLAPGEFKSPLLEIEYEDLSRVAVAPQIEAATAIERRGAALGSMSATLGTTTLRAGGRTTRIDVAVGPTLIGLSADGSLRALFADDSPSSRIALEGSVTELERVGNTLIAATDRGRTTDIVAVDLPTMQVSPLGSFDGAIDDLVATGVDDVIALSGETLLWMNGQSVDLSTVVDARLQPIALGPLVGEVLPVVLSPRITDDVSVQPGVVLVDRLLHRAIDLDTDTAQLDVVPLSRSCRGEIELIDTGIDFAVVCHGDTVRGGLVERLETRGWTTGRAVTLDTVLTDAVADPETDEVVVTTIRGVARVSPDVLTITPIEQWEGARRLIESDQDVCALVGEVVQCENAGPWPAAGTFTRVLDARWRPQGSWIGADDALFGDSGDTPFGDLTAIRGEPDGRGPLGANAEPDGVYTIVNGGEFTIGIAGRALLDGPGVDLLVCENAFYRAGRFFSRWIEPATIALSFDGVSWVQLEATIDPARLGTDGADPRAFSGFAGVEPVLAMSRAFDPMGRALGCDRFDLSESGLPEARFVRLADAADDGYTPDIDAIGLRNFAWR